MDNMEKVEKLRERANVTYEEAKKALEENNWDLLDAMVSLEKQGKTREPGQTSYSTSYEQQEQYLPVKETINDKNRRNSERGKLRGLFRKFIRICRNNSFHVTRGGTDIIQVPVAILVLILLFFWKAVLPVMIIALFFNIRYHFAGKDDLQGANDFMESAGDMADRVRSEFTKSEENSPSGEETRNGEQDGMEKAEAVPSDTGK